MSSLLDLFGSENQSSSSTTSNTSVVAPTYNVSNADTSAAGGGGALAAAGSGSSTGTAKQNINLLGTSGDTLNLIDPGAIAAGQAIAKQALDTVAQGQTALAASTGMLTSEVSKVLDTAQNLAQNSGQTTTQTVLKYAFYAAVVGSVVYGVYVYYKKRGH
jgi:hypothetical protein